MTNHLDKSITIAGFPATKLKAALLSWERTGNNVTLLGRLAPVSLSPGATAAMIGEAWNRGLLGYVDADNNKIDGGGLGLTMSGLALVTAEARGRTTKKKAKPVLDALLDRAQKLMGDGLAPRKVSQIWVFGSYIDPDKADIGDIDIVIDDYRTKVVPYVEIHDHIEKHYPGYIPESFTWQQSVEKLFISKSVFGVRRHPLLSVADLSTLKALHRPCALVFDEARGGKITPEFHDHHPDSLKRGDEIMDRLVLPDFSTRDEKFRFTHPMIVDPAFKRWSTRGGFDHLDCERVSDTYDFFSLYDRTGRSLNVHRTLDSGENASWRYNLSITVNKVRDGEEFWRWEHLAHSIVTLAHADLARMASHRAQGPSMYDIVADMQIDVGQKHPLRKLILDKIDEVMQGGPQSFCPADQYGLAFACDGDATIFQSPSEFNDEDWECADNLPFSKEEYREWLARLPADFDHDETAKGYGRPGL